MDRRTFFTAAAGVAISPLATANGDEQKPVTVNIDASETERLLSKKMDEMHACVQEFDVMVPTRLTVKGPAVSIRGVPLFDQDGRRPGELRWTDYPDQDDELFRKSGGGPWCANFLRAEPGKDVKLVTVCGGQEPSETVPRSMIPAGTKWFGPIPDIPQMD